MPEEETEETELDELTKLRDDYEKIECNGISVKYDAKKGTLVLKIHDDENEKTYYLVYTKRTLTMEQRIGLRAIGGIIIDKFLWESGGNDVEQMLYA